MTAPGRDAAARRRQVVDAGLGGPPDWYRDAVVYEVHVRAFADSNGDGIGDFRGLTSRLDYVRDLGVTALWVLPFYPSPMRDDGYDIADYRAVNPMYGTMADFRAFLREAHDRGLRVITELVLNHTSEQHRWFQRARRAKPGSRWREWYVWSDTPDRYADARIIFSDFESSNWTWDPVAGAYFWHRFYAQQPDLNYEHPDVQAEMMRVVDFWFEMGVDGLRLDAVPYLFEEEGTMCENLPATHAYLRRLRAHVDDRFPNRLLLAEANQWPEDAVAYFGSGDECHMAFHFPVMPRLFMALQLEDRFPVIDILEQTPPPPLGAQWAVFLRNHDELTLEMVTDEERDFMYRVYARDQQARVNLGIRRRLAPLLEYDRKRIELLNGLLMSLPGTPVLYYGDEIGMGDNVYLGDRNGVRTPMQWSDGRNAGFSEVNPQRIYLPPIIDPSAHYEAVNVQSQLENPSSLLWWMRQLLGLRRRYPVFGRGDIELLHPDNSHVLAFLRSVADESVLVVANLSRHPQYVDLDLSRFRGASPVELFGQTVFPPVGEGSYRFTLGPHGFYWFAIAREPQRTRPLPVKVIDLSGSRWAAVFAKPARDELAHAIRRFLPAQRWHLGKERRLRNVQVVDVAPLESQVGEAAALVIAEAGYTTGEPDRYVLPLVVLAGEHAAQLTADRPGAVIAHLRRRGNEAVLAEALGAGRLAQALLGLFDRRRPLRTEAGELRSAPTPAYRRIRGRGPLPNLPIGAEQSNTSIVFGDRLLMKLIRKLGGGQNPEQELGTHLTRLRFPYAAPLAGAIEYATPGEEPSTVAVFHQLVPNEGDLWERTVGELGRRLEHVLGGEARLEDHVDVSVPTLVTTALALSDDVSDELEAASELLGTRLAELHAALATGSDGPAFAPEPFTRLYLRSLRQSLRTRAQRSLQRLRQARPRLEEETAELADAVLAERDAVLEHLVGVTNRPISGMRIRTHGDLHLGQVLWTGRDVMFIDFEGEPIHSVGERRLKRSPLRDVAGLLRSYDYALWAARSELTARGLDNPERAEILDRLHERWYSAMATRFLRGYLRGVEGTAFAGRDEAETIGMLSAFALDKALYEITYELAARPAWLHVPLRGVLGLTRHPAPAA